LYPEPTACPTHHDDVAPTIVVVVDAAAAEERWKYHWPQMMSKMYYLVLPQLR
jgi:hypothetical protein